ncbi:MAG: hypothetical protein IOC86_02160 [Aestuariivirga sp.]|nr:hypothetical protein [Aestuariivirga sp.]
MATMIQSLPSTQVSGFSFAGQIVRKISAALSARRARIADQAALLDMDPRLLADIGAARGTAAEAGLATLNPAVLSASLYPAFRAGR